jgi:cysteinyl-tRNA synthetase
MKAGDAFGKALDDDLNISAALAVIFDMIRTTNRRMDEGTLTPTEAISLLKWFKGVNAVLGFEAETEAIPAAIGDLLTRRAEARAAKEWKLSDTIRDEILATGWIVKDTKEGQKLTPAPRGGP